MKDQVRSELQTLASACRILALHGHEDMSLGHAGYRDPEGRGVWMKARGPGLSEIIDERNFVLVDWDGEVLEGDGRRHSEWPLHTEIMAARPDLYFSVHSHPEHATLLSATDEDVACINQDAVRITQPGVARYGTSPDLVRTRAEGAAVATAMGDACIVLLRNHGVSFFADEAPKLALTGIYLERAARSFLMARASGLKLVAAQPEEAPLLLGSMVSPGFIADNWAYLLRLLARHEAKNPV